MSVLKAKSFGDKYVSKKTRVTVDVDERGRFTVPEPARRVVSIAEDPVEVVLEIRVLEPDDAAGNQAITTGRVDERGRATIKPAKKRSELGIHGREAVVEIAISKKHNRTWGHS